jgi:hypothetical protein
VICRQRLGYRREAQQTDEVGSGWGTEEVPRVLRSPTRSAADPRSRLGVRDGLTQIASPSSRVQILETPPTPGSAALHPGLQERHPLRGFLAVVLSCLHQLPTRSAADPRSGLGVGDRVKFEDLPIAHVKRSRPTKWARSAADPTCWVPVSDDPEPRKRNPPNPTKTQPAGGSNASSFFTNSAMTHSGVDAPAVTPARTQPAAIAGSNCSQVSM